MRELISIINTDIRGERPQKVLAKFKFKKHEQVDELDEGVETEYWFSDKENGIELRCNKEYLIKAIFLHSGRRTLEASKPYSYPLIDGLSLNSSSDDVRLALGKPSVEGTSRKVYLLGEYGPYDRYDYADWSIHFQYVLSGGEIETVTIVSKDWVPTKPVV